MKKFLVFVCILIVAPIIAGIYGILHDQLTYTIAPEYYTKFKFYQFGLVDNDVEAILPNPRIEVSFVGFLATWWMGIPIGIILGLTGLIHPNWKRMLKIITKSFLVVVGVAFLIGLIGLAYGRFYLANLPRTAFIDWYLPDNLIAFKAFISVGSMHNFSYVGGIFGLIAGIIYNIVKKTRNGKTLLNKTMGFKAN